MLDNTESDFYSPSEQEEVDAASIGIPVLTDKETVEILDERIYLDYEELTSCGCSDPLCPCTKPPFPTFEEFRELYRFENYK